MSVSLNKAIYRALIENSTITDKLALDPRDGSPAVYASFKSVTPPVYPQITFREQSIDPRPGFIDATIDASIDNATYLVEVWTDSTAANAVAEIFEAVDRVLHNTRIALPDGMDTLYWIERVSGGSASNYDPVLKVHFGLFRYRAVILRS